MGFFDQLLGDNFGGDLVDGFFGSEYQKDYTHASKLMRPDSFALAPNTKFLFHVYFEMNVPSANQDTGIIGALVKTVQLPSFNLDTKEYIQYNRKRNIHSAIKYNPVTITLHDDASDNVRSLWHNYYSYYFADTDYSYDGPTNAEGPKANGLAYNGRDIYKNDRTFPDWGMTTKHSVGNVKQAFFKSIRIYGMSRGNFISYTLVNPVIDTWAHDTYSYAEGNGTMEHTMTVRYEAVKYGKGKVKSEGTNQGFNMLGFGDESRYDTSPSILSKSGSTASIFGQAGALDTATGALEDLSNGNIFGAIRKFGTAGKTFKDADSSFGDILKDEVNREARTQGPGILKNLGRQTGILYPKASKGNSKVTGRPKPLKPTPIIPQPGQN